LLAKRSADLSAEPEETSRRVYESMSKPNQIFNIPLRLHRKKDGSVFPVEITARSLIRGGRSLLLVACRDISERKQAEVALLALSARQKAILAAVPDIIMEVDVNKVYTWANQAGIEFFGEDVLGKQADSYFEGEQHTYGVVQPLFNGNETVIYVESWQRRRDGEKRLLAWCCRVLKDSSGNVTGALSSALDITERKQIEKKLRESEEEFRSFFELTADLAAIADIEGHFRQINSAWSKTLGYPEEELLGKPFMDFIHPDDKERTRQVIAEKSKRGKTILTFENRYIRKDGSVVWLEWTSHPDTAKDRVFAIARDVTARRQAEERIRQLARHLETVREEEHKRFADALHDELGQALTAIKIDLATVAAECPAEDRLKAKIVRAQKLLAEGILGVHTLCRELRPGALDDLGLKEALDGLTADWKPRTDVKCVFSADIDEEVLTDKIRTAVFRIVQEALTNVSNHAQASQVVVNLVADECILHFSVADNGRGMAPGAESKPETFGLLGMRERLEALGGELHIESSPGKGTRIEGSIPLPQAG
jgi:PAS domain S-box-containing protein